MNLKRPDQIKAYLDKYVVGQEEAKKTLSVAVYNHYKRLAYNMDKSSAIELEKSNVILLGPTGCGKTHILKTIAKYLKVPIYIGNATSITESGYVGDDIESLIVGLLRTCDYDIDKAQKGIVVIDEGDKLAKRDIGVSLTKDVSGEGVQQGLLKMVEGHVVGVPPFGGRKHPEVPLMYVDTTNILFILSGAFVGLEEIIARRTGKDIRKIGFTETDNSDRQSSILHDVEAQDLRSFGFIPEFVGRFPIISWVDPLEANDLCKVMTEPKNALTRQYEELMKMDGIELKFDPKAVKAIAEIAVKTKTGARGLRQIVEKVMRDIMFSAPKNAVKENVIIVKEKDITKKFPKQA